MSSTSISLLTINHSGLSTRHRSARFCWLPSHVGIPGYEQADQANLYFDPFNHPLHFYPFQHHPHPRQLQLLPISILPTHPPPAHTPTPLPPISSQHKPHISAQTTRTFSPSPSPLSFPFPPGYTRETFM